MELGVRKNINVPFYDPEWTEILHGQKNFPEDPKERVTTKTVLTN